MKQRIAGVILVGAVLCPSLASGQSRLWLDVGFGVAMSTDKTFSAATSFLQDGETANFSTDYRLPRGNFFGVGAGIMFGTRVGAGINISRAQHDGDTATLFARIPHPILF